MGRRWTVLVVASSTMLGTLVAAPLAAASSAPLTALFWRNSSNTQYREAGVGGATVNVSRANLSYGSTTVPGLIFSSEVNAQLSTHVSVTVSAGLTPGTYTSSRIPGAAEAVLDPGSFSQCGGNEPGTLTITEAAYDGTGKPTVFAASYDIAACDSLPPLHGELRWASSVPLAFASAPDLTKLDTPVVVNSTADLPVAITAAGDGPVTLGTATLHQTPLWDGSLFWSVVSDGCSGVTLVSGATCTVVLRFAPRRPDGNPVGTEDGWIDIADGTSIHLRAAVEAQVAPLPGQPLGLQVQGAFRHLVLTWTRPQAFPADWSPSGHTDYQVYRIRPDGSRLLLGNTGGATWQVLPNLPDGYTGSYVVTASQGSVGPESVPATGTTATSELLYMDYASGLVNQRLSPNPEANATAFRGSTGASGGGMNGQLTVSRDQSVLAFGYVNTAVYPPNQAIVLTTSVGGSSGRDFTSAPTSNTAVWDTEPSLSPDGTKVVFTHADTSSGPTVLRIAATTTGATAQDVPGSAGLSQAVFSANGTSLIAVQAVAGTTQLVQVNLSTGALTPIAGSTGLSEPDVAADGRIVAVAGTDTGQPAATGLFVLAPGASQPSAIPAAQAGSNQHPRFSGDGTRVFYTHNDTATTGPWGNGYQVTLADGTASALTTGTSVQTPYVLQADGQHRVDQTAPAPRFTAPATAVTLVSTVTAQWTATDPAVAGAATSGVWNYDVRYRSATPSRAFTAYAYPAALQKTTTRSATLTTTPGTQLCFSVRARDNAGNVSSWTADRCAAMPLDDRSLSTKAARRTSSSYYRGTYSAATAAGTAFTRGSVTARRVAVVMTTCATSCGAVDVWLAGKYLGRVSGRANSTHYRQVLWLPSVPTRTGTLTLRAVTNTPVRLDGVVTVR